MNPDTVNELLQRIVKLERALRVAINTVECASLDKDGSELPWYIGAKIALGERPEPEY